MRKPLTGEEARTLLKNTPCSFLAKSLATGNSYQCQLDRDAEGNCYISFRGRVTANAGYHYLAVVLDDGALLCTKASPYGAQDTEILAAQYVLKHMVSGRFPKNVEIYRLSGSLRDQKVASIPSCLIMEDNLQLMMAA